MSNEGPTDERSALAWVMSGTVGALVVGGLAKRLIDRRRERAFAEAEELEREQAESEGLEEAEGHPS
jgi:hypothetical protein